MVHRHDDDDDDYRGNPPSTYARRKDTADNYSPSAVATFSSNHPPDNTRYEILDTFRHGLNLVIKVKYDSCAGCSYEGTKILCYAGVPESHALKWREIDPHFVDSKTTRRERQSPGPVARFPASDEGWNDAVEYAKRNR